MRRLVLPGEPEQQRPTGLPILRRASGLFVRETPTPAMHGRDRNKTCPCKSGRKWKRCHGRNV